MSKNKKTKELVKQIDDQKVVLDIDHLYIQLQKTKDKDKFINDFSDYLEKFNK